MNRTDKKKDPDQDSPWSMSPFELHPDQDHEVQGFRYYAAVFLDAVVFLDASLFPARWPTAKPI